MIYLYLVSQNKGVDYRFPLYFVSDIRIHPCEKESNFQKGASSMAIEDNKALAHRFHEEIFSQGNIALIDEICDTNWTFHDRSYPQREWPRGPEGAKQLVNLYRAAFPDLQFTYEDQIAEGDKVVSCWTARGTHKGDLMGIPPTGKQATITGITIMRIANGKIAEDWANFDVFGMLQQLGAIPAATSAS